MSAHHRGPRTLAVIAIFKFAKAALLVVVAIALFRLRHPQALAHFAAWLGALPVANGHEAVTRLVDWMLGLSAYRIEVFCAVVFVYATLYTVEGYGLWRDAEWAKYLTIVATSLFIPVELWEVLMHFTWLKLLALAINVAIVAYLVRLLRREHAQVAEASVARP